MPIDEIVSIIKKPLTRATFIKIIDNYMASTQDEEALSAITPPLLYGLMQEEKAPEELLFRPVFHGVNLLDEKKKSEKDRNNDGQRFCALAVLCTTLKLYCANNRAPADADLLKILLQKKSESTAKTVLHVAAEGQYSVNIINYLLQLAASLEILHYVEVRDDLFLGMGATPLYYATQNLQIENMNALLQHGADPLAKTRTGISIYQVLVEQISKERGVEAIQLLYPFFKKKFDFYTRFSSMTKLKESKYDLPLLNNNSLSDNNEEVRIVKVRLLLDFVLLKENNLSAFVEFLHQVSTFFNKNMPLRKQFLSEFVRIEASFLKAVAVGVLNVDLDEQKKMFRVAFWLISQTRHSAALALFERLLSDKYSLLMRQDDQVFEMLRWAAISVGNIYVKQVGVTRLKTSFLEPLHAFKFPTDKLLDLHALLEKTAMEVRFPALFRERIKQLLAQLYRGQAYFSPLLGPVPEEVKAILDKEGVATSLLPTQESEIVSPKCNPRDRLNRSFSPLKETTIPMPEYKKNSMPVLKPPSPTFVTDFFSPLPSEEKTKNLLTEARSILDQVYPPTQGQHIDARKAYLMQLAEYESHSSSLTKTQKDGLTQLIESLKEVLTKRELSEDPLAALS